MENGVTDTNAVIDHVISATSSDVILFTIILLLAGLLIGIPLYRSSIKLRKEDARVQLDEKSKLMEVIERNTAAFTNLEATIKYNNQSIERLLDELTSQTEHMDSNMERILEGEKIIEQKVDSIISSVGVLHDQDDQ